MIELKKALLFLSLWLLVWGLFYFTGRIDAHHFQFQDWIKQDLPDNLYHYSAIKYLGAAGLNAFGDSFFLFFPAIIFFLSVFLLYWQCQRMKIEPFFLFVAFFLVPKPLESLLFFTRENCFFFFACIFTVAFFDYAYRKMNTLALASMIISAGFMFLFRETAFVFVLMLAAVLIIKNRQRIGFMVPGLFFFPSLGKDLEFAYNYSLSAPLDFKPNYFFAFNKSGLFCISFFKAVFRRDLLHWFLIVITLLYCFAITTVIGNSDLVLRYSSGLIPLHFFYILKR